MKNYPLQRYLYTKAESDYLLELDKFSASNFKPNHKLNELILRYRATQDKIILTQIIRQVMRFIVSIAKRYKTAHIDIRDLIHEALEGVTEAINYYYKIETPEKFITYIKSIVERRIKDSVDSVSQAVELPKNIKSYQGKLKGSKQINNTEIIYSKKNIKYLGDFKSFYTDLKFIKINNIENKINSESLIFDINRVLDVILTVLEKTIIVHNFGLNNELAKPLDDISDILKATPQKIGDLKSAALNKIRSNEAALTILKKYLN